MLDAEDFKTPHTLEDPDGPSIPQKMASAHRAVLYDIWDILRTGQTGDKQLRGLAERLQSHFAREEELLGAIASLDTPEEPLWPLGPENQYSAEDADIDAMASFLESELWEICSEHDELRFELEQLWSLALDCSDSAMEDLAMRLEAHLAFEEDIHLPATLRMLDAFIDRGAADASTPDQYPPPGSHNPPFE